MPFCDSLNNNIGALNCQALKMDYACIFRLALRLTAIFTFVWTGLQPAPGFAGTRFWVFFQDNEPGLIAQITQKALTRRLLRTGKSGLTRYDLTPDPRYIARLNELGYQVHQVSRWLNAASVSIGDGGAERLSSLNFVKKIQPVASFRSARLIRGGLPPPIQPDRFPRPTAPFDFDYGLSYSQIHVCRIDSLHSLGYTGAGVLVGMMDTGYDLSHPVFYNFMESARLIATYDFINNDSDVQGDGIQMDHGTATFSALGGFGDGSLIGAAFGADFMLAKTEIYTQEVQSEEDNWIAAAEWMEAAGVDIISSSLGYFDWYDQTDLDGNTTAITIAADIAASLGVIIVNAAGNERNTSWDAVIPPADGDSVIAVGGVNQTGLLWSGSSPGPTADGRIKPDVVALASTAWAADYLSGGYRSYTGTSLATPVVAGGLALIIESHPQWTLGQIIQSLKATASRATTPDNDYGWGIARFFGQFASGGYFTVALPESAIHSGDTIKVNIAVFDSQAAPGGLHDIDIYLEGTATPIGALYLSGPDTLTQDIYFPSAGASILTVTDEVSGQVQKVTLSAFGTAALSLAIAPNPAIDSVIFLYDLLVSQDIQLTIYTAAGDKITSIHVNGESTFPGLNRSVWRARNNSGEHLAPGIYIVHFHSATDSRIAKFAFVN